jgi:SAM-dependent methyltransferase
VTEPPTAEIKRDLRRYYDTNAAARDERGEADWRDALRTAFAAKLRDEDKRRLLEIGAGSGHSAAYFATDGFDVVATDLSPEHVEHCLAKGLHAHVADFYDLAFSDGLFDAIWAMSCLLHVPDADLPDVLGELSRVLIPGGLLHVGLWEGPNREGPLGDDPDTGPQRFFALRTDDHARKLFGNHFSIESFASSEVPDHDMAYQVMLLRKP